MITSFENLTKVSLKASGINGDQVRHEPRRIKITVLNITNTCNKWQR